MNLTERKQLLVLNADIIIFFIKSNMILFFFFKFRYRSVSNERTDRFRTSTHAKLRFISRSTRCLYKDRCVMLISNFIHTYILYNTSD